ncbi:unnamed protein product [Lactuca virosa]|uniref:Uncharacterized protein n=1 Tax=Lactuca virosa TaxID=75947 RepID=A0AAU9NMZ0_9ASTR|nr:unnamed protein product [Lactuca virosa]
MKSQMNDLQLNFQPSSVCFHLQKPRNLFSLSASGIAEKLEGFKGIGGISGGVDWINKRKGVPLLKRRHRRRYFGGDDSVEWWFAGIFPTVNQSSLRLIAEGGEADNNEEDCQRFSLISIQNFFFFLISIRSGTFLLKILTPPLFGS